MDTTNNQGSSRSEKCGVPAVPPFDYKQLFHEQINPLMKRLHEICVQHGLPYIIAVNVDHSFDGEGKDQFGRFTSASNGEQGGIPFIPQDMFHAMRALGITPEGTPMNAAAIGMAMLAILAAKNAATGESPFPQGRNEGPFMAS